jgi:hypothetical protein
MRFFADRHDRHRAPGSKAQPMTPAEFTANLEKQQRTWIPVTGAGNIATEQ